MTFKELTTAVKSSEVSLGDVNYYVVLNQSFLGKVEPKILAQLPIKRTVTVGINSKGKKVILLDRVVGLENFTTDSCEYFLENDRDLAFALATKLQLTAYNIMKESIENFEKSSNILENTRKYTSIFPEMFI